MSEDRESTAVCSDGEHALAWDSEACESVCVDCGVPAAELVRKYGHSLS